MQTKNLSSTREGEDINKEGISFMSSLFVHIHSAYSAQICLVSVCKHRYCLWAVFHFGLEQLHLTKTVSLSCSEKKMMQALHLDLCVLGGCDTGRMFQDYWADAIHLSQLFSKTLHFSCRHLNPHSILQATLSFDILVPEILQTFCLWSPQR